MKRYKPLLLFGFCWLLILLVPPLRRMFWAQATGQSDFYGGLAYGPFPRYKSWLYARPSPLWKNVRARYPNDLSVLALEADRAIGVASGTHAINVHSAQLAAYDALIRRFPQESWLIARRLKMSIGYMYPARRGGEFADSDELRIARHQSPERVGKDNFTVPELNAAIAAARLGQEREPDNAFYDYALACFLLMAWRDDEAWRVLAKGSHKPHYDMHYREWLQAELRVRELQWGRPLLFEDFVLTEGLMSFPELSGEHEMGRIITWEGYKAERDGKHAKALQIYTDTARLHALHSRQCYFYSEAATVHAVLVQALSVELKASKNRLRLKPEASATDRANFYAPRFARYATQHGRADLASEATRNLLEDGRRTDAIREYERRRQFFDTGIPTQSVIQLIELWWAAAIVLLGLALLLPVLAVTDVLLRWTTIFEAENARRDSAFIVFFCVLAVALCVGIALHAGAGWRTQFFIGAPIGTLDGPTVGDPLLYGLLLMGALTPAWLAVLLCYPVAMRRFRGSKLEPKPEAVWNKPLRLSPLRFPPLNFILSCRWIVTPLQFAAPLVCLWLFNGIPDYLPLPGAGTGTDSMRSSPLVSEIAFVLLLVLFPVRWIFGTSNADKPHVAYQLRLLHTTLSTLLIVGSATYLLLLAVSLSVRAETNARIDRLVERGSITLILQNTMP